MFDEYTNERLVNLLNDRFKKNKLFELSNIQNN